MSVRPPEPPRLAAVKDGIGMARSRIIDVLLGLGMLADGLAGHEPTKAANPTKPTRDVNRGVLGEIEDELCELHNAIDELQATKSRLIAIHG